MQLSHNALGIGYAVRQHEGSDVVGVGPHVPTLVALEGVSDKSGDAIRRALNELEGWGLIKIDYCIGTNRPEVPKELRDVAGISILEPLQQMFDDMGI